MTLKELLATKEWKGATVTGPVKHRFDQGIKSVKVRKRDVLMTSPPGEFDAMEVTHPSGAVAWIRTQPAVWEKP
jgi:hypothetical protein